MKIGIDLGGTNMRLGIVDEGKLISRQTVPCPATESADCVVNTLVALIRRNFHDRVTGIGIGVPTVVDSLNGIVYNAVNIPSWKKVFLKDIIEDAFSVPVAVNNDANCFALGEARFGVGKGYGSVVGVTLGTGVGAGLVLNGSLYSGRNTGAGEIGELPYLDKNFEYYCSSGFFSRIYATTGKTLADKAYEGDKNAKEIWEIFGVNVGNLVKAVMFAYDPELIVFGGGISSSFSLFQQKMNETIATFPYPESVRNLKVSVSSLSDVAILGASALV